MQTTPELTNGDDEWCKVSPGADEKAKTGGYEHDYHCNYQVSNPGSAQVIPMRPAK